MLGKNAVGVIVPLAICLARMRGAFTCAILAKWFNIPSTPDRQVEYASFHALPHSKYCRRLS